MTETEHESRAKLLQTQLDLSPEQRLLVVAHDQGAAEIIADLIATMENPLLFSSLGPARQLFDQLFPSRQECDVTTGLNWCDIVIVGTGWQTDWEISTQSLAQTLQRRTAVVLDNWLNFKERFNHHSLSVTPNEIWVVDDKAEHLAHVTFPETLIRRLPWSRYESFVEEIRKARNSQDRNLSMDLKVLFLSENMREFGLKLGVHQDFGFDQFDAINFLTTQLRANIPGRYFLVIRPHPSEDHDSYSHLAEMHDDRLTVSQSTLLADLVWCDIVVGMSSIAMYFAQQSGIPTFACFPDKNSKYDRSPWDFPDVEDFLRSVSCA